MLPKVNAALTLWYEPPNHAKLVRWCLLATGAPLEAGGLIR
jgi:hypothetical protein